MSVQPVQLLVSIGGATSGDFERADEEARRLRTELAEFDVESVEIPAVGAVPAGAKSAEAVALGSLLVTLLPSVVPKMIEFLQSWALRGNGRTIKIRVTSGDRTVDVEVGTGSEAEVKKLLATISGVLGPPGGGSA